MGRIQRSRVQRPRRWLAFVLGVYWSLLFIGTHIPRPETFIPPGVSDKLLHFCAFAGLAFLYALCRSQHDERTARSYVTSFAVLAGYAALDEILQMVPFINRNTDFGDWVADVAGILAGLAAVYLLQLAAPP